MLGVFFFVNEKCVCAPNGAASGAFEFNSDFVVLSKIADAENNALHQNHCMSALRVAAMSRYLFLIASIASREICNCICCEGIQIKPMPTASNDGSFNFQNYIHYHYQQC